MVLSGAPAYAVLLAASALGAAAAVFVGGTPVELLAALPTRLVALLESDLLQALPLFVLMGALIDRLPIVDGIFRTLVAILPRRPGTPLVAGLTLGALIGPMNGSAGASVLALARSLGPRLDAAGTPPAERQALVAVAGTLGVVVPPSLVLILLGDALLNAHTIAVNATGRAERIVNTQDIFRGALVPAALFFALAVAVALGSAWVSARRGRSEPRTVPDRPSRAEMVLALVSLAALAGLLGAVVTGLVYAVEAAATGCVALLAVALVTGRLGKGALPRLLGDVMVTTGALFALMMAATTFTLVLRLLGTDRLVADALGALPGTALPGGSAGSGEGLIAAAGLAIVAASAFVLDAFEIVFVVVPIVAPPVLMRVTDPVWFGVLLLLVLQTSFLLPPFGYAVLLSRGLGGRSVSTGALMRALAPYLVAQILVVLAVAAAPALVHRLDPPAAAGAPAAPGRIDIVPLDDPGPPRFDLQ